MATLAQILTRRWPGQSWTLTADNYATLEWEAGNSRPKPSESELRALSAEVDAEIANINFRSDQQSQLLDDPDMILRGFELLARQINKIRLGLPANVRNGIDWSDLTTIGNRLRAIRNDIDA